jgi:diaminopimelate epimerase
MKQFLEFAKLSGSGNDFICIDSRNGEWDEILSVPERIGHFVRTLCPRGMSVGADGVIFACTPEIEGVSDIAVRYFDPDGSEIELCGNGTGCFVRWVTDNGWVPRKDVKILTCAGVVRGEISDGQYVRVCIPTPEDIRRDIRVRADGRDWTLESAVTGTPHAVAYVDDVAAVNVDKVGAEIRHHSVFGQRGANVNFVQVLGKDDIAVRTFEFGVEGETLACGTGSATAAVLTAQRMGWANGRCCDEPIRVHVRSRDVLRVYFTSENGAVSDVCLETVVRPIYTARLHPQLLSRALDLPGYPPA